MTTHDIAIFVLLLVIVATLVLFLTQKLSGPVALTIGAICAAIILLNGSR